MRRKVALPLVFLFGLLAAAPASGLFKAKSVSGNLGADSNIETVQAERVPDPSDPSDDTLAQTAVEVVDQCGRRTRSSRCAS